jgi:hypothetical protein
MYTVELEREDIVFFIAALESRIQGLEHILETNIEIEKEVIEITQNDLETKKNALKKLYDVVIKY